MAVIAVRRGRAGSSDRCGHRPQGVMMNRWWLGGVAVVAFVALVAAGCSSKKKGSELEGQGGKGLSDESLGTAGGSLGLAQAGRGGAEDTGPLHDVHFDYDSFELDE